MNDDFICIGFQAAAEQFPTRLIPMFRRVSEEKVDELTVYFQFCNERGHIEAFMPVAGSSILHEPNFHAQFALGNQTFSVGDEFLCGFALSEGDILCDAGLDGFRTISSIVCKDARTKLAPMLGVRLAEMLDDSEMVREYAFEAIKRMTMILGHEGLLVQGILTRFPFLKDEINAEISRIETNSTEINIVLVSSKDRRDFFRKAHRILSGQNYGQIANNSVFFDLDKSLVNEDRGQRFFLVCSSLAERQSISVPDTAMTFVPSNRVSSPNLFGDVLEDEHGTSFRVFEDLAEVSELIIHTNSVEPSNLHRVS